MRLLNVHDKAIRSDIVLIVFLALFLSGCPGGGGDVVAPPTATYTVGGNITGLAGTGLVLQNNSGDDLAISANGAFTFATAVDDGAGYSVTVKTQPAAPNQTCTVNNGTGTVSGTNVTGITVICSTNAYTVGGSVTGLAGTGLVLQNNGGDDLTVSTNGAFTFATAVADGAGYSATVKIQPSMPAQTCSVTGGTGTVAGTNISTIAVICAPPDLTPPVIVSNMPADAATDVAVNTIVTATFSETMDASTINATTFTLKDSANNPVNSTVSYSGTTATFTPSSTLASTTAYTATISTGVKDLAGNAMSADYSWSFTTGIAPDVTPPTIVSTTPANGATDVALNSTVSATFSEAIDPATINASTFYVRYGTSGGFFYGGTVSYSGITATFTPTPAGWPYDAPLTGLITTGVKDLSGNAIVSNYTWGFRTALPPQGALDTSFGAGGKATTDISGLNDLSGNGDHAKALIVQSDGKIVAAGNSYAGSGNIYDFSLARYNADGALDTSFGTGGKVMTAFGGDDYISRHGLAMQTDGMLVVAGTSYSGCCGDLVLARYNVDGTLDANFGTNGKVIADFNGGSEYVYGFGLQSDGKIVVSVGSNYLFTGNYVSRLLRYNPDGTPDTGFGTGGQVTDAAGFGMLTILSGDRILVLNGGAVARYSRDGVLDTTFGTAGKTTAIDMYFIDDMAVQADGKIIVAGGEFNPNKFAVVRYNADGSVDTGFGSGGKVTTEFGGLSGSSANAVKVQGDGKIVVAGSIIYLNSYDKPADFALARYNTDGTLDATFGSGGLATTDFNNGSDWSESLAIQSDGKIVTAGRSNADFALVRYLGK